MHRAPAGPRVVEALTVSDANTPPLQAALGQLQAHARRPGAPPGRLGAHDQIHQRRLRGRIHPARDPATQPQGPFPSTSVNLTAISANAVRRRSISAPAASSSTSRCLSRRPGRERASASSAPCRATSRSFATVDRSTRAPIRCLAHRGLPTHKLHPDLVLLLRRQEPLPLHTRLGTQHDSSRLGPEPSHAG